MSYIRKIDVCTAKPVRLPIIGQTIGNLVAGGIEQAQQQASQSPMKIQVQAPDGSWQTVSSLSDAVFAADGTPVGSSDGASLILASAPGSPVTAANVQEAKIATALSQDVYSAQPGALPAGYSALSTKDVANIFGTDVSSRLVDNANGADFQARIYVNYDGQGNPTYSVAFRGTQGPGNIQDDGTDFGQAQGYVSPAYQDAINLGVALANSPVDAPIILVGHSLGGGLASAASIASGFDAVTINASGLSANTINVATAANRTNGFGGPGNVQAYFLIGDPLNMVQSHPGQGKAIAGAIGGLLFGPIGSVVGSSLNAPPAYGQLISITPAYKPANGDYHANFPLIQQSLSNSLMILQHQHAI